MAPRTSSEWEVGLTPVQTLAILPWGVMRKVSRLACFNGPMPASGTPFLLELCPAVSFGQMPAHHHHSTTHGHFENCPFGSAPAAGPVSQAIAFDAGAPAISYDATLADSRRLGGDVRRAHRPRGPPLLA